MIIISIKPKYARAVGAAMLLALLGYFYYLCTVPAFKVSSNSTESIEIFDISKGSVTKSIPVYEAAVDEAEKILKSINGLYIKAKAIPEKGLIIRIPFEPVLKIKNKWLNDYNIKTIDKMYIVFPEEGESYLFVLDEKERPYLFTHKSSTEKLLKKLQLK